MFQMSLFRHQQAVINSIRKYPDIPYIFLIGGYGCGKSATDVALCLYLYESYHDSPEPVTVGIFGVTIKLLKQTVIADLERAFERGGIAYKDNSQAGTIKAGNITFVYLAMQNPDDIYAFNFHCAICDEIDEVPAERVMPIVTAIQERCRKTMPAGHHMPSRPPFICFTTTAQGLGGTYQLLKHLEKHDLGYIKIRGRTVDNTSIDPQQLENLMELYEGDERKAFLEGEFVNLSTGRVYPVFDMTKHKIAPKQLMQGEQIYVGQDFNAGYNAAVICIVRGNTIYAVREERWDFVGDAAVRLREMYPDSPITLIPDASGKEIMSGFSEEFSRNGIDIHWNNVNPSITERITAINTALRYGQLYIFDSLDQLLLGLETRDFDDMGKPRKGKGPKALDHNCLAAGTPVTTLRGEVPIEQVVPGDMVLSHDGRWHKVTWAGKTGTRKTIERFGIRATPDHPVMNQKKCIDFSRADSVEYLGTEALCRLRKLFLMEELITVGLDRDTINHIKDAGYLSGFTGKSGNFITDLFLKAMKSIILTVIQTTTQSRISPFSRRVSMLLSIMRLSQKILYRTMLAKGLPSGTGVRLATGGIRGTASRLYASARYVIKSISRSLMKGTQKAQTDAGSVQEAAHRNITIWSEEDVYNLSVHGTHTFFAGGILVHNCDALEYCVWHIIHTITGYDRLLDKIAAVHHNKYTYGGWDD